MSVVLRDELSHTEGSPGAWLNLRPIDTDTQEYVSMSIMLDYPDRLFGSDVAVEIQIGTAGSQPATDATDVATISGDSIWGITSIPLADPDTEVWARLVRGRRISPGPLDSYNADLITVGHTAPARVTS